MSLGSNYLGHPYLAQGYAKGGLVFLKSVTTSIVLAISYQTSFVYSVVKSVALTLSTTLTKHTSKALSIGIALATTYISLKILPLRLRNAVSRYLNANRVSRFLNANRTSRRVD